MHNTIYKVLTRFVTEVLTAYSEANGILTQAQEGFQRLC